MITVARITSARDASLDDINELLPQLRSDGGPLGTQEDLEAITSDPKTIFVAVKEGTKIVGIATAYVAVKFGKKTGFVEDVVISDEYRGQGLGRRIMEVLIEESRRARIGKLYLTSRPERVAANKLYQKLGFEKRETNVYQLKL